MYCSTHKYTQNTDGTENSAIASTNRTLVDAASLALESEAERTVFTLNLSSGFIRGRNEYPFELIDCGKKTLSLTRTDIESISIFPSVNSEIFIHA
jgi:hypothetical protein